MMTRRLNAVRARLLGEIVRFGVVGAFGYVSDVSVFNVLRWLLGWNPLLAKAVSLTVSTTVGYAGNRLWTYRDRPRTYRTWGQYALFYAINGIGALIELAVLWFSHYVLGYRSVLADNVSGNVIGMAVATLFRFWGYRTLVFPAAAPNAGRRDPGMQDAGPTTPEPTTPEPTNPGPTTPEPPDASSQARDASSGVAGVVHGDEELVAQQTAVRPMPRSTSG